jgi:hypothetical protein
LQEATAQELADIQRLQLHTTCNSDGCTALHYAAAAHKPKLVQQLLQIGADVSVNGTKVLHGLGPLHLACMGAVVDASQMEKLVASIGRINTLLVRCCSAWLLHYAQSAFELQVHAACLGIFAMSAEPIIYKYSCRL